MTISQRLIHLSQEHDAALKLAQSIRSLTPEDPSSLPDVAREIRKIFQEELVPHFADEERYVMPRLEAMGRDDLIERMRKEHRLLGDLADALQQPSNEAVRNFASMLTAHVSFEENIVWEELEPGAGAPFEAEEAA